jgi:toxin HigB-1
MKTSFANQDIENLCKQVKLATRKLGNESAKKLQRRISECYAANTVGELIAGRPHPLEYDRLGQFALDLHKGDRLIFGPTEKPFPVKTDGSIDWAKVADITMIEIEDYHD